MHKNLLFCLLFLIFSCDRKNLDEQFSPHIMELYQAEYSSSYFNRYRKAKYHHDVKSLPGKKLLRLRSRNTGDSIPVLNIALILPSNAYQNPNVKLEPNALFPNPDEFEIIWEDTLGKEGLIYFNAEDPRFNLDVASQIYDQIVRESKFYLKTETEKRPILSDSISREAFHISMIDFYGLARSY